MPEKYTANIRNHITPTLSNSSNPRSISSRAEISPHIHTTLSKPQKDAIWPIQIFGVPIVSMYTYSLSTIIRSVDFAKNNPASFALLPYLHKAGSVNGPQRDVHRGLVHGGLYTPLFKSAMRPHSCISSGFGFGPLVDGNPPPRYDFQSSKPVDGRSFGGTTVRPFLQCPRLRVTFRSTTRRAH